MMLLELPVMKMPSPPKWPIAKPCTVVLWVRANPFEVAPALVPFSSIRITALSLSPRAFMLTRGRNTLPTQRLHCRMNERRPSLPDAVRNIVELLGARSSGGHDRILSVEKLAGALAMPSRSRRVYRGGMGKTSNLG